MSDYRTTSLRNHPPNLLAADAMTYITSAASNWIPLYYTSPPKETTRSRHRSLSDIADRIYWVRLMLVRRKHLFLRIFLIKIGSNAMQRTWPARCKHINNMNHMLNAFRSTIFPWG